LLVLVGEPRDELRERVRRNVHEPQTLAEVAVGVVTE
jgi:hypothetical protein